jgi:hypothetical protein
MWRKNIGPVSPMRARVEENSPRFLGSTGGRLAYILGLRDANYLVDDPGTETNTRDVVFCRICCTLVSQASYNAETDCCDVCTVLSEGHRIVPSFPSHIPSPEFEEFQDSHQKIYHFDTARLVWRCKSSVAQDRKFMREWRVNPSHIRLSHYYVARHFDYLRQNSKKEDDIPLRYSQVRNSCLMQWSYASSGVVLCRNFGCAAMSRM